MPEAVLERKEVKKFTEDPLFSVIVPIYNISESILKRCLMSISDQNYKNLEVVLVFDGEDKKLYEVAKPFLETQENWKYSVISHKGACAARNAGFDLSSGEIVAFVNSDYILKRGIIRLWVDRLLENKDCGFAYGGYEYNTKGRNWYQSKPFDPYQLDVANYIDCGFPLWRKYVVKWDENCKSLQDWDFWLRVVKTHKVKGFFLGREVSFVAEPPRPQGLTEDSSSNWVERVKYVKNANKIPLRDILVVSLGAPNHGIEIAKMIGADFRDDTIFKPNEYQAVYMIGFYLKPGDIQNQHGPILSSFKPEVKKIVHWVGADIYWMRKHSYEDLKNLGGALRLTAMHLVENEEAQRELKDLLGLDADIVPIPPSNEYEVKDLPVKFSVAVFLTNKSDFDKYYKDHTLSIIRACPDIQFNIYGDADEVKYPNMTLCGNLNKEQWKEFVYKNSCLLRLTKHDTTPLANNEFMMAGRRVISNIPKECTNYVDTSGDSEINKWDLFQPGFTTERWALTKKKIIQELRKIKRETLLFSDSSLKERFNRQNYINKIYDLSNLKRRVL